MVFKILDAIAHIKNIHYQKLKPNFNTHLKPYEIKSFN